MRKVIKQNDRPIISLDDENVSSVALANKFDIEFTIITCKDGQVFETRMPIEEVLKQIYE